MVEIEPMLSAGCQRQRLRESPGHTPHPVAHPPSGFALARILIPLAFDNLPP